MNRVWILGLVLVIAISFGCGKKEEAGETETAARKQPKMESSVDRPAMKSARDRTPMFDPISKETISKADTLYKYVYESKTYYFKSSENLETFKKNPEKYIKDLM
jgi:YHS domain-containing protein